MGFDEWMAFYDHYTVVGAKCTATFVSQTDATSATANAIVGIHVDDDTSTGSVGSGLLEMPKTSYKYLGPASGKGMATVSRRFSPKKFFGRKYMVGASQYTGTIAASPTETAFFDVFVGPINASANLDPIIINITLEYLAVLTERRTLTQS